MQLRTQFTALLMNLILGELLVSGLGLPMDALAALQRGWKMGRHACVATGFVLTTLGYYLDIYFKKFNLISFDNVGDGRYELHADSDVYLRVPLGGSHSKGDTARN